MLRREPQDPDQTGDGVAVDVRPNLTQSDAFVHPGQQDRRSLGGRRLPCVVADATQQSQFGVIAEQPTEQRLCPMLPEGKSEAFAKSCERRLEGHHRRVEFLEDASERPIDDLPQQRLLVVELEVDRALGAARLGGDVVEAGTGESSFGEVAPCDVQNALTSTRISGRRALRHLG